MRLTSLDVLRGWTVLGMIVVNSAAGMKWGPEAEVWALLIHVEWDGLTLADLVFPAFLTMVGVSIPFSLRDRTLNAEQTGKIVARTARLLLLGFILSNLYWFQDFTSGDWRLFGVLQRIGLVYGACALLFLCAGPRLRLGIAAALLILYWPLVLVPGLDGVATDIGARGQNFAGSVDRMLLGPHRYVEGPLGYDPEGLLGTIPAIAQGLIGIAIGELLARGGRTRTLVIAGAAMVAVGLIWAIAFPIIKDIWSSSFVLVTSGATVLVLAGLHEWLDQSRRDGVLARTVTGIGLPFGTNAIAAYALHMITAGMVGWQLLLTPFHATRDTLGDPIASLIPVFLYAAFIWLCMRYLQRRGWIIKI